MPPKVPVACVGIDNGKNAALLAIQILSIEDNKLQTKLLNFRSS
jgi:5-(carboxyamino)imidazole ribonucleotide mutase|tara:strand:+ start:783 stop:914 length:132 start_codon:yes stop_codon:yes gene_type:complete